MTEKGTNYHFQVGNYSMRDKPVSVAKCHNLPLVIFDGWQDPTHFNVFGQFAQRAFYSVKILEKWSDVDSEKKLAKPQRLKFSTPSVKNQPFRIENFKLLFRTVQFLHMRKSAPQIPSRINLRASNMSVNIIQLFE